MQDFILFGIPILIMSVVVHEVSHGYVAELLGDPTARMAGRLTLNPLKHLDPVGSVLLPALLVVVNAPVILGWARPVPYNPYNLRSARWGPGLVAVAGSASNLAIAVLFSLLIRFGVVPIETLSIVAMIVLLNIVLAVFNLIPIPPLDGSKVLQAILPYRYARRMSGAFEQLTARYGLLFVFLLVFVFFMFLLPIFSEIVFALFTFLSGMSETAALSLFRS